MRFEDGSVLRLYRQTMEDFAPFSGQELTQEEYDRLCKAAAQMSAKMRAVRIVAASNVSQKDLERRLIQKGENPEQARQAVDWMRSMDLVDDRKTAEQIVQNSIHKGYGLARAKQALYEKRIPKELWEEVLADYPDQQEYVTEFLHSRVDENSDKKEIKRAIDALMRKGHRYGVIRTALQSLNADWQEE